MELLKNREDIQVSVENITSFGIWMYIKGKEYFLSYEDYPALKDHAIEDIQRVELLDGLQLHWPNLDIILEIDSIQNPWKFPLKR